MEISTSDNRVLTAPEIRRLSAAEIHAFAFSESRFPRRVIPLGGPTFADLKRAEWELEEQRRREEFDRLRHIRIPPMRPTESHLRMLRGEKLCMCASMGHCPLMARLHPPDCDFCTSPFVMTYYPSDMGWWNVRHQVKETRSLMEIEDEIPPTQPDYYRPRQWLAA